MEVIMPVFRLHGLDLTARAVAAPSTPVGAAALPPVAEDRGVLDPTAASMVPAPAAVPPSLTAATLLLPVGIQIGRGVLSPAATSADSGPVTVPAVSSSAALPPARSRVTIIKALSPEDRARLEAGRQHSAAAENLRKIESSIQNNDDISQIDKLNEIGNAKRLEVKNAFERLQNAIKQQELELKRKAQVEQEERERKEQKLAEQQELEQKERVAAAQAKAAATAPMTLTEPVRIIENKTDTTATTTPANVLLPIAMSFSKGVVRVQKEAPDEPRPYNAAQSDEKLEEFARSANAAMGQALDEESEQFLCPSGEQSLRSEKAGSVLPEKKYSELCKTLFNVLSNCQEFKWNKKATFCGGRTAKNPSGTDKKNPLTGEVFKYPEGIARMITKMNREYKDWKEDETQATQLFKALQDEARQGVLRANGFWYKHLHLQNPLVSGLYKIMATKEGWGLELDKQMKTLNDDLQGVKAKVGVSKKLLGPSKQH
jgi:hypothetical protein